MLHPIPDLVWTTMGSEKCCLAHSAVTKRSQHCISSDSGRFGHVSQPLSCTDVQLQASTDYVLTP